MPYPFWSWPTFDEVRQKLLGTPYNCRYKDLTRPGDIKPVGEFERSDQGKRYSCPVSHRSDERLSSHVVGSIMRRLGIEPKEFGLDLDPLNDPPDDDSDATIH